jgi:hypothetical protein
MKYTLPKASKDLRIKHFKALETVAGTEGELVAAFLDVSYRLAMSIDARVFIDMYKHILKLLEGLKIPDTPPQEITMDGIVFELVNPEKVAHSWHADFGVMDFEKNRLQMACLFYHPKGAKYGDIDENDNIIHSIEWKEPIFEQHMELSVFVSAARFFLLKSLASTSVSMEKEMVKVKISRVSEIISTVGKRFGSIFRRK